MEKSSKDITLEQLRELGADGQSSILCYLTGYLAKSAEFQSALTSAYNAELRMRTRLAARATGEHG